MLIPTVDPRAWYWSPFWTSGGARWPPCWFNGALSRWVIPWWPVQHGAACEPSSTTKAARSKKAGPSAPVQVLGLSDVADAGEGFVVAPNEKIAGRVADKRGHWRRQANIGRDAHALSGGARLEDIFEQIQKGEAATLNLIVKADVNGSLEAVTESLRKLEREDVRLAFVHRAVGRITENDIQLAATSNATIIGFNVRPERKARVMAEAEGRRDPLL